VKKKTKDRTQKKGKDAHDASDAKGTGRSHGRGSDAPRGRGRGAERGRAGRGRGASAAVNGAKKTAPTSTTVDSNTMADNDVSWDTPAEKTTQDAKAGSVSPDRGSWEVVTPSEAVPPTPDPAKTKKPDGTRSWASMLKPTPKPKPAPAKAKAAPVPAADPVAKDATGVPAAGDTEIGKPPAVAISKPDVQRSPSLPASDGVVNVEPSHDELTKTNLDQVQDVSTPAPGETVASNAGTDQRGTGTPSHATQQQTINRPGLGGFATTAQKAASGSTRSSSYQRRVKDQQEAVVMPGNHAVDRTAVQFGSLGLGQEDLDDEREEPETRAQPPQSSPIAPRASLPPAQQAINADTTPTSRPPGLPAITQAPVDAAPTQPAGANYGYNQFSNIYGSTTQGDATVQTKQYEPLGQGQHAGVQGFDNYPAHSQAGQQMHGHAAYSSAGSEYPSYYSADNQRAYQNYYGYGHQIQPQPHETAAAQQKMGTGFGGANGDQVATAAAAAQTQAGAPGRFGASNEGQPSGHSTPNPSLGQQPGQGPQSHHVGHGHGPAGGHGYPYAGNPYYSQYSHYPSYMNQVGHHSYGADRPPFDDVRRYDEYLTHANQFGYGGRHGGYNAPYGKGFGQPHSYGMSSQSPFDPHSGSPANAGPYGQPHNMPGRDNSSLGSYGRAGSAQPSDAQSHSTSAFAGMSDVFNRTQSGYSTQASQQTSSQQGGTDDASRGYNEGSKLPGGPSPAPGQGGARPGSAANLAGQSLPTTQAQAYGGYPSQMGMHGQQSQYGGLSGLGGHGGHHQGQTHQNTGYGNYGSGFGGNYYNSNTRGGWGGNYGH
jgi:hypothetical protein